MHSPPGSDGYSQYPSSQLRAHPPSYATHPIITNRWIRAETVNGYYKTELVRGPARPGPWRTVEDLELATLGWVHWHNTQRLHGYLGDVPPAEFEQTFYAGQTTSTELVGIK